ncbi:MAG: deoxyribonuclease V [Candidatus Poribacteria bacterium]|nr:deoxyribonuclease V [Candidatus Poribacteria bacterium]MDE0503108.1 deoxyribonuclease V [Candidatus Poribacteria bacterium]
MQYRQLHSWDVSPEEARNIQNSLCQLVTRTDEFGHVQTVAGVDLGFKKNLARASVVVLRFPGLEFIDGAIVESSVRFPYIPGLLSFREIPPLLKAFDQLKTEPDIVIADGQGLAHPRRLGLACHLGLILDKPVIGCAKSRLLGEHGEPDREKGSYEYLFDKGEVIGAAVRTRRDTSVIYVSIGHRISLESAIGLTLRCCKTFRLPETTRYAHKAASEKIEIPNQH